MAADIGLSPAAALSVDADGAVDRGEAGEEILVDWIGVARKGIRFSHDHTGYVDEPVGSIANYCGRPAWIVPSTHTTL